MDYIESWVKAMVAQGKDAIMKEIHDSIKNVGDVERFEFICNLCTEQPSRFRKVMSQALTLDEYRAAIDKEMAK